MKIYHCLLPFKLSLLLSIGQTNVLVWNLWVGSCAQMMPVMVAAISYTMVKGWFMVCLSVSVLQACTSSESIVHMIVTSTIYLPTFIIMKAISSLMLIPSLTIFFCSYVVYFRSIFPIIIIITWLIVPVIIIITVSYTHLDVYKRQGSTFL